ncbi:DUF2141 domain-containing protein [Catalinimonas sp. 4WD22]|uniref:DUF2141 domain-containing protein n=1 Tax=Catalinimonas locisalis TaxID=3133978 RepID=UPI003100EC1A
MMISLILSVLFSLFSEEPVHLSAEYTLSVTVDDISLAEGTLLVDIFDKADHFLETPFRSTTVKVDTTGSIEVSFEKLPQGTYAVSVIHDHNDNGELDMNAVGIPTEGYGFSKDAMGMFGPPSFEKAQINIEQSQNIHIHLR